MVRVTCELTMSVGVVRVLAGYINFNDWTVGGPDESFWGSLLEEQILDKDDTQIGEVDFGRAWVAASPACTVTSACSVSRHSTGQRSLTVSRIVFRSRTRSATPCARWRTQVSARDTTAPSSVSLKVRRIAHLSRAHTFEPTTNPHVSCVSLVRVCVCVHRGNQASRSTT
jgi:hypothetical protein